MSLRKLRSSRRESSDGPTPSKKSKTITNDMLLHKILHESGLQLKYPPEKCIASEEIILVIRNIKKKVENQYDYPRNESALFSSIVKDCEDIDTFKHYLFPNIVRKSEDGEEHPVNDSVMKVLLSIPILQNRLTDYIFEKATELAVDNKCAPWILMILKCFSTLDCIVNVEKIATNLINLLDISSEKMVRLQIITSIPDIVGDQEHENIAAEMSRFLSEDHELIPAILDCLSYLCLSDEQYEKLQKKTLTILSGLSKCIYFPNFVKFLLMPGRMNDFGYLETVQGIRNALGWSTSVANAHEIATSQVLTASAIRYSMISSKMISNAWIKSISMCKADTELKPIDIVILILQYSTTEEKQRQVEAIIQKQIKGNILKEDLVETAFEKYKPILKEYLQHLISLSNTLLKNKIDNTVEAFASHMYSLIFSELEECRPTVIAELLQLDQRQCVMNVLFILNNIAAKDMSLLKPQSLQMLTLLDRMDGMSLTEIKAVMNLVCGLAYTHENSIIRDDIHMIIRKELASSSPTIKIQGILAGLHAVKYLIATTEVNSHAISDEVSYSSIAHLSDGSAKEAAQIIERISCSTRQFPDLIAFFYDELSEIMSSIPHVNHQFMSWLTDAITNDLQQTFIVDSIPVARTGRLKLSMQHCLNTESEMDEVIAINISGLVLDNKEDMNVGIISPLFQLVQTLHYRQHEGNLSSIDALLGCPVVMPEFDVDLIEDLDNSIISHILDCLIHCVNWFRELSNAFATQNDEDLKSKLLQRILQIEDLEALIGKILLATNISYKPPICTFDISKYSGGQLVERKGNKTQTKQKKQKQQIAPDDTILSETAKSQVTQNNISVKNKLEVIHNIPLRKLSLKLLKLFNNELSMDNNPENSDLSIKTLKFLLKFTNSNLESVLISKIKRKTFLTKQEDTVYDAKKAEECAKNFGEILPKLKAHLNHITSYIDDHAIETTQDQSSFIYNEKISDYIECLEYLFKMYTIYFKWIGFKNHHTALLKCSLRTIIANENDGIAITSLKDLLFSVAKFLQMNEKFCLQLTTAIALIGFLETIQEHSNSKNIYKILRDMAQKFLSQLWKTPDGAPEKGLFFNESVDKLAKIYFMNNEIVALKSLSLQLINDIQVLKTKNDTLGSLKCISKGNFPVLYRNLGTAIYDATKTKVSKGLTNAEHLELWKDVATCLKYQSEIAKTLENRNNLSAFFKKSMPILKLFLSQGMPILELQFKNHNKEVLEILKILQQSTRFLQSLCCHSRLKKDTTLMAKVPFMRQMLETLIYKVKAALAANKCSEAFWMGNLKNKNIHGEIIATQASVESEESVEDGDDQLPEDDDIDDSEEEMIGDPDSRSLSDVI